MRDLKTLWKVFERGDRIEDDELRALIKSAKTGLEYLDQRGPEFHFAYRETRMNLIALEDYQRNRQRQRSEDRAARA